MGGHQIEAHHGAGEFIEDIPEKEEIPQGFGHFFRIDGDKAVMEPVMHRFTAVAAFGLGDFVFVMGEDQIRAAAVNIEGIAEVFFGHGGAFDMPAGTAFAPGAFPIGFAGFRRFPQREIEGISLLLAHGDSGAGLHFVDGAAGKFAVGFEFADFEVDVAVDFVGEAVVDDLLYHGDDIVHMFGDPRMNRSFLHAETAGVLKVGFDVFVGQIFGIHAFFVGAVDDLIVHIGEVLDISHIIAAVGKVAAHHIKGHDGTGVAQMDIVIGGGAADIHFDFSLFHGNKFFFFVSQCIIDSDRHFFLSPFSIRFPALPGGPSGCRWRRQRGR